MKRVNKNLGYKYLALGLLLSANLTVLAFDAAEIDALKPAQRRLRKLHNESARARLDAQDKLTRDDLRELTRLRDELDYLESISAVAASPDGSGSESDGEYRLNAEERAKLDATGKIKLSQERSRLERILRAEQAKPDRSRDARLISKLRAEIAYIDDLKEKETVVVTDYRRGR